MHVYVSAVCVCVCVHHATHVEVKDNLHYSILTTHSWVLELGLRTSGLAAPLPQEPSRQFLLLFPEPQSLPLPKVCKHHTPALPCPSCLSRPQILSAPSQLPAAAAQYS